jgi:hypothetical protein
MDLLQEGDVKFFRTAKLKQGSPFAAIPNAIDVNANYFYHFRQK